MVEPRAILEIQLPPGRSKTLRATHVRPLDAAGHTLPWLPVNGMDATRDTEVPLAEGRATRIQLPLRTTELLFLDGDREVARTRVQLRPGQTNFMSF